MFERHTWGLRAHAAGTTDTIPKSWKFAEGRLNEFAGQAEQFCARRERQVSTQVRTRTPYEES